MWGHNKPAREDVEREEEDAQKTKIPPPKRY